MKSKLELLYGWFLALLAEDGFWILFSLYIVYKLMF
jgi:hypothetical protein